MLYNRDNYNFYQFNLQEKFQVLIDIPQSLNSFIGKRLQKVYTGIHSDISK